MIYQTDKETGKGNQTRNPVTSGTFCSLTPSPESKEEIDHVPFKTLLINEPTRPTVINHSITEIIETKLRLLAHALKFTLTPLMTVSTL